MRMNRLIATLWGIGLVTLACYADRPVSEAMNPATLGAAGKDGGAGSGDAGATGIAGTTGAAGTGAAGTGVDAGVLCVQKVFEAKSCARSGACHDAQGSAANFSLAGLPFSDNEGWAQRLVAKYPKGAGQPASMCGSANLPYLVEGSFPATGLLLDKLRRANPPCGDQMPAEGAKLTTSELGCVQNWANVLVVTASASAMP
jgi:hypothetical protein